MNVYSTEKGERAMHWHAGFEISKLESVTRVVDVVVVTQVSSM